MVNILIFRTDRIGDLIFTCPTILTIKDNFKDSNITLITSEKNTSYAKKLNIFENIFEFPKKNIFSKISFIYRLSKINFSYIFVFDGKERSIYSTAFIKSKYKIALAPKIKLHYRAFKIKYFINTKSTNLNDIFQEAINYCQIDCKISNYNFLSKKSDNNFSSNISIKNYLHIHLDEKWVSNLYIKKYTNINPNYDEFIDFLNLLSEKSDVLITTGLKNFDLINELKDKFFEKKSNNIFFKKNFEKLIYFIYKPTFDDIESLLRNSKVLIACHGAITHASNSFDIKKIDIVEHGRLNFYKKFTSYLDNYHPVYRSNFASLKREINKKI